MKVNRIFIVIGLLFLGQTLFAQNSTNSIRTSKKREAVRDLSKSLEEGKSDEELAANYERFARELAVEKEYAKAEENYLKAKAIYQKLKNIEKATAVEHEITKLKESQNKENEAGIYVQRAQSNMNLSQNREAISNYEEALKLADKQEDKIMISNEIANVYVANNELDKAIEIQEKLVEEAKETADTKIEIAQLRGLASTYFETANDDKGIQSLRQAYTLAVSSGQTLEAKKSVELLAEYYRKNKKEKDAIRIYTDFVGQLEALMQSDSSLVDAKIVQVNEEKIAQLEKERSLKDELIEKKNRFNYFLLLVIVLILGLLVFIIRSLMSIRIKNKKIALQSLRREMNPHFIFNSLNSVNQFIAQNNELEANKYLSSYSKLMRTMMENSNKDFIPLSVEMEHLKEYLQLEYMRFSDKFTYEIEVDKTIDTDTVYIPNMLIQPQLENAIWHGLRYKEKPGHLLLKIYSEDNRLFALIEDDGIGIRKSKQLKTERQKEHQSRGLINTYERIDLLNQLYHTHIRLDITEKEGEETGVIVKLCMCKEAKGQKAKGGRVNEER
jgi:tetratricopeptide (TPR) repeat protein